MDQRPNLLNSLERQPARLQQLKWSIAAPTQAGVDRTLMRKEQVGFRSGRGTVNQIFILRNILEQINEWNAILYIHFEDFEKAFDSCSVIDNNETTDPFPVMTGVKQGCCISGFLFLLVVDWVMQQTIRGKRTGIRWDFTTLLEELDFRDDTVLLSSAIDHLQSITSKLEENSVKVGLKLNAKKCQQQLQDKTVLEMADVESISVEVMRRRWNWIGHVLRKDLTDDCVVALWWTPEGRGKRGRPKNNMATAGGEKQ
ncbi:uncharacterized protein LOC134228832 [Saccostrea cucullata]|uniref:uncharacterized protein LOC134228832 n=1 Tax=Saccostrea cuccullata TaxID=36930 RepID=UPI002ED0882F